MITELEDQFFNEVIAKVTKVAGVDIVYFLRNSQVIKEHNNAQSENYLAEVQNILKSDSISSELSSTLFSDEFHTYSFLNESGLMVISKLSIQGQENLYMVIVAGENEPVDLLNLLRICKEARQSFLDKQVTSS